MRSLKFLLQKEFRQIFRDPSILRLMLVMPIIQLILLPMAANYEVKHVKLAIVDHDHSSYSTQFINKIIASKYFILTGNSNSYDEALKKVEDDKADIILEFPVNFEKSLIKENNATVFMGVNAVNGARANLGSSYLNSILRDFNQDIRLKWIQIPKYNPEPRIEATYSNWFNTNMNYKQFMVPGILVILLTMVGANMAALNIVKEKEIGTIEQINVSPVKKYHFILAKLIPFWIIGQIVLTIGLLIALIIYGIVPVGNPGLIYLFSSVYLLAVLGMGLLVSTYAHTQQQAMLISFFIMMIFILLGGLYTSIESMPDWAQIISKFNPIAYFIRVMRMVVMKGSQFKDILPDLSIIFIMALIFNGWAILSYRKRA